MLLLLALLWSERELKLRFLGEPTKGQLVGMVLQRQDHSDLLTSIETELVATLANGDEIHTTYRDYELVTADFLPRGAREPRALSQAELNPDVRAVLSLELRQAINEAVRGDVEVIRWMLMRESRRSNDFQRVLRLEKTETVHGYFKVPQLPEVLPLNGDRITLLQDSDRYAGVIKIHAVCDRTDPALVEKNKGQVLTDYEYTLNGQPVVPTKKNFYLTAEPYSTEFRPVFAFDANALRVARLSHIARHGGPTLALRLYGSCQVYYDPKNPTEAVLIADPGAIKGDWLAWFSRACEGTFGQWGSGSLIALAGFIFLSVGMLFISLAIKPVDFSKLTPLPQK